LGGLVGIYGGGVVAAGVRVKFRSVGAESLTMTVEVVSVKAAVGMTVVISTMLAAWEFGGN
jgi:hypothetical protein